MPLSWSELKLETRPVFRVADFAEWQGTVEERPVEADGWIEATGDSGRAGTCKDES